METKNQDSQVNKSNRGAKQLKYDYTELDKFLNDGLEGFNKDLVRYYRDLLCSYSDMVTQIGNEMSQGNGKFYIHREATECIYQLEDLFRIIEDLKEIPE